jgi:YVTN family beta-propeller protein
MKRHAASAILCPGLLLCVSLVAQEAPIPAATSLPGTPFSVKKSWNIGGVGNWDYLTIDPAAQRLYIAHGAQVQVVDIDSGTVIGAISGFTETHQIALDDTGPYGYVTDGRANAVVIIDRSQLKIEAKIPVGCSPRSIAFEPRSDLVFAVCGIPPATGSESPSVVHRPTASVRAPRLTNPPPVGESQVIVIDPQSKTVLGDLTIPGDLRFAQSDGQGVVYITSGPAELNRDRNGATTNEFVPQRIVELDASAVAAETRRLASQGPGTPASSDRGVLIDWTHSAIGGRSLALASACVNPRGLAADARDRRLFVACDDQRFLVLDSNSGNIIASLTTGPGDDTLAYDADRNFIFIANGAGYGSLTIVQQDATTDSYAVIQNLPTMERARTLAVDPANGEVYLVTDLQGVDLTNSGGIGTLHSDPVPGSFKVLVVGH